MLWLQHRVKSQKEMNPERIYRYTNNSNQNRSTGELSDMIIREAMKDDLEEIIILAKQLKVNSTEVNIKTAFSKILKRKDHIVFVCVESHNRIVGYIHGLIRIIIGNPVSVEVGGMIVQPEYRGKGLGTLLLSRIEEWAEQNQIFAITLASSVQRLEAHKFYIKNGYTKSIDRFHFLKDIGASCMSIS